MAEVVPEVLARKWLGFGASIWVQAFAGNTYAFPNYSPTLKKIMQYNQLQLNNLGVAKDLGENVGLIAGLVCDKLPPWVLLLIGAFNGLVGYGVLWLAATARIPPLPYWQMCVALGIGANSSTWFNTAVLLTSMRNFPHSRGTVVGILKGFVGLSGAIFAQLSTALFPDNPIMVLFLLAMAPTLVSLVAMHCIVPVKPTVGCRDDPKEHEHFVFIIFTCIGLAIYILGATIVDNFVSLRGHFTSGVIAGVMLIFLAVPLLIPFRIYVDSLMKLNKRTISTNMEDPASEPLLKVESLRGDVESNRFSLEDVASPSGGRDAEESLFAVAYGAVRKLKRGPRRGQDFKLKQALVKADFWLLFFSFFCGVGSGVTAINNMGQLGEAQGYSDVSMFISLVGVWNFLGRLGGGALSEFFVRAKGIPRPIWMAIAQALMIIAHVLFASAVPGSLHVGSAILGICYGVQFTVMVPTASELFGLKHFGVIYNFITLGDPLGSCLFSGWLAGSLYDREAERQREWATERSSSSITLPRRTIWDILISQGQGAQCRGAHCFRLTFFIMAGVCVVGVISSIILSYRIRPVYLTLYEAREASNSKSRDGQARDNQI